ncbi:MAG: tetratricopeptide repeat protein, partial [Betaproteobacteria bacterium]
MAKINQVKLRQEADAAEKAGRFDRAIDALKQIVQESARDWNTINRIGDLYGKLNNPKAANEQYVKVARYFADDGFYLKAIAVWKKVLRNEPALLDGHVSLGELYQKQGLVAEARQTFGFVYDEYVKRNKLREAGEVLRRMADLDPSDMKVRIRLAELYGREGNPEKAAAEFVGIAEELVKKGLLAEALQLLEKALRGGQRSARLLSAAARVHLVQKDFARAVALLEEARRAAPADRELALRLAEACVGARRGDQARSVLQALLDKDPGDQ